MLVPSSVPPVLLFQLLLMITEIRCLSYTVIYTEFNFHFFDCTGAEGLLYKAKALRTEGTEPAHLCWLHNYLVTFQAFLNSVCHVWNCSLWMNYGFVLRQRFLCIRYASQEHMKQKVKLLFPPSVWLTFLCSAWEKVIKRYFRRISGLNSI